MAPAALGYFTGVFLFFQAAVFVANALGSAVTPHLGRAHAAEDGARFRRLTLRLVAIGAVLGLAGVAVAAVLGEWALALLCTPEYAAYGGLLTLAMAAAGLRLVASFLQIALIAAGRFKAHLAVHAVLAAAACAAAPPLVGAYGLEGGAYTLILVGVVQLALLGVLAVRSFRA